MQTTSSTTINDNQFLVRLCISLSLSHSILTMTTETQRQTGSDDTPSQHDHLHLHLPLFHLLSAWELTFSSESILKCSTTLLPCITLLNHLEILNMIIIDNHRLSLSLSEYNHIQDNVFISACFMIFNWIDEYLLTRIFFDKEKNSYPDCFGIEMISKLIFMMMMIFMKE